MKNRINHSQKNATGFNQPLLRDPSLLMIVIELLRGFPHLLDNDNLIRNYCQFICALSFSESTEFEREKIEELKEQQFDIDAETMNILVNMARGLVVTFKQNDLKSFDVLQKILFAEKAAMRNKFGCGWRCSDNKNPPGGDEKIHKFC